MKPSFALNFTDDSIQLLHRTGKGWVPVGETPFAAPNLDDALSYMRKTALGLEPGGFTTKLVIPNSQIRYVEVEAPGPDEDTRRAQIVAVLESQTPLRAHEIAFDWSGKGKTVKVAAVARETLAEAEGFASMHRFNPVSFAAIPDYGDFSGEPWFGTTDAAAALLNGETVERDKNPLRILLRDLPLPAEPVAEPQSAAAMEMPEVPVLPAETMVDPIPDPSPDAEVALQVDLPVAVQDSPAEAPVPTALPEDAPSVDLPVATMPAPEQAVVAEEAPYTHVPDNPAFPEDEVDPPAPAAPAPVLDKVLPDDDLPPAPSPAAMVAFSSRRAGEAPSRAPAIGAAERPDPAALARAARGKPVEELPPMPRPAQASAKPAASGGVAKGGIAKGLGALVTAPSLSGSRKAKTKAALVAAAAQPSGNGPADAAKSLTRPGGTFGNRPPPPKSRTVLFLSLVAILLLCLALVAAWSSFYLASRGNTSDSGEAAVAVLPAGDEELPAIEDEMLADGEEVTAATESDLADATPEGTAAASGAGNAAEEVDLATESLPETVPEAEVELALPAPSGVTSDDPAAQNLLQQQDEIFLATADSPPPALDALSLPAPEASADALPAPQMPPPRFGTVYRFDANGLLVPTPEGIVSPEGVLLIAGKPPQIPPSRSEAAIALAAAAAATPAGAAPDGTALVEALPVGAEAGVQPAEQPAVQPDPDLADRRPKSRPDGLAPNPDDAALAPEAVVEFVSLRPRQRPGIILAAGEQARQETAAAAIAAAPPEVDATAIEAALAAATAAEAANPSVVAISRRPAERPKDFSRAVEAAVAAAIRAPEKPAEPEPEPERTAKKAPAPDLRPEEQDEIDEPEVASAPAPKIPTKATVAKQATFKNALNLSKINLIGVYGTQSKRYALIRQANGKYKKVKVGDKIDGGKVEAITQSEVRYQKGGRLVTLKMPKG